MRLRTRVGLGLLATGLTLLSCAEAPSSSRRSEAPGLDRGSQLRDATERELQYCSEQTLRGDGPASNDCRHVPDGPVQEDDPWGRWDCRTDGNLECGTPLDFELLDRPGCFIEPSSTPNGWEIIWYSDIRARGAPEFLGNLLGFEIPCPS